MCAIKFYGARIFAMAVGYILSFGWMGGASGPIGSFITMFFIKSSTYWLGIGISYQCPYQGPIHQRPIQPSGFLSSFKFNLSLYVPTVPYLSNYGIYKVVLNLRVAFFAWVMHKTRLQLSCNWDTYPKLLRAVIVLHLKRIKTTSSSWPPKDAYWNFQLRARL